VEHGVLVPPARLGGRPRARAVLAAFALVATLVLAVLKPWGSAAVTGPLATSSSDAAGVAVAVAVAATSVPPATPQPPAWPVQGAPGPDAAEPLTIRDAAELVALRAGEWGVGAGGSGPRLVRDEVWADWLAVTPGSLPAPSPASAEPSPEGSCAGLPVLVDRPSILAVTTPVGSNVPAWHLAGWWSDGSVVTAITRSLQVVTPPRTTGATVLQRLDRAVWPSGRYDFQLTAGKAIVTLAMCLEADA
jgi:hypothetical protein